MACIGKKQRERIIQDIHLHFKGLDSPSDFKLKNYLIDIYQLGLKQGVKEETALNYMQVIPEMLNLYLATTSTEISEDEDIFLTKLKHQFKKNNLEFIHKNIIASKSPVTVEEKPVEEELEKKDEKGRDLNAFNPYTNVVLSTTLPETFDGTENIDPDRAWHHNFNRKLLNKKISPTTGATDIALGNHRGFRIKAVKMSSIPYEELDKSYKISETISPENIVSSLDKLKRVALVITDNAGNILRFDEKYNVSPTGKIIFFNMRDTSEAITTDTVKSRIQSISEISKNLNISEEEAKKLIEDETNKLRNIQNAVFDGKEILLDIIGGSLGIIPRDQDPALTYDKALTTIGELMDSIPGVKLNIETEKPYAGRVYAIAGDNKFLVYNRNVTNEEAMEIAEAAFNYLKKSKSREFAASIAKDFITQYIAFSNKEKNNLEAFLADDKLSTSIDSIFSYIVKKPEQSRNRFISYQGIPNIAYGIENKIITQITQSKYLDFWKEKLKVGIVKNTDNTIALRSSYLNFQPTAESMMIVEGKTMKEKKVEQDQSINIRGRKIDPNAFFKNKKQLSIATQKQIDEALEWFKNSDLSKILPGEEGFIRLFDIVNSNAKATFSRAGIKLYFGSNFTDLYHESWHAFSQLFLTIEEKEALYEELKKLSGSFVLPNGVRINYSDASYIQLEEVLGEDFRQYKLSNGSKVLSQRPVRNKIFRFILKFLDWLFDGVSFQQADTNFNTLNKVHNYYKKLDTNNYKDLKPDFANMMPGIQSLASPIGYDTNSALSVIESEKVSDSIDSVISDVMTKFAKQRKISLISDMFTSKQSLINAYSLVKEEIQNKIDELSKDAENNSLALSILNRAIVNFGDIESILEKDNIEGNTTIEYHLRKSKILDFRTKEYNDDEVKEDSPDYVTQKDNQENGKLSFEDLANERVLYLIRTLKSYKEEDGSFVPEKDDLGFDKLNNYRKTLGILINNLNSNTGPNSIYKRLQNIRKPEIVELIEKLGPIDPKSEISDVNHFKSWILFSNSFNTTKLDLILTKFDTEEYQDSVKIYNVQASSDLNSARYKTLNNFRTNPFNKFATEVNGELMLDMAKVIDQLGENPSFTFNSAIEFFKNLGIPLDSNIEDYKLDKTFANNIRKQANYVFNELKGHVERKNNNIIANHIDLLTNGSKSDPEFKTQKTVIDSILKKYIEVSDLVASFSLLNAENEREYENVLNSNITITQNTINESDTYDTLIQTPGFEHFDKSRNPMARVSQTLKRVFDDKGNKIQEIQISKFSGVQENKNGIFVSGQSTIDSDPVTKFYLDFYSYLLSGFITNPTPADKKTYLGFGIKDSSGDMQFIKPKTFLDGITGDTFFENMMFEYLKAEHERVYDTRNNLVEGIDKLGNFSKFGKYFLIFDNILEKETKKELYEKSPENLEKDFELIGRIKNEITEYINALTDKNLEVFNKANYQDESVLRRVTGLKKITNQNVVNRALIKAHTANTFVQFIESTILFYGDIAAYELLKQDFHKRNSAASSSGRTMVSDPNFINSFNNLFGYEYAKSQDYEYGVNSDGYINTAIFEDHRYENKKIMDEYVKSWEKAYTKELKALGKFTDEQIKEKVDDIISKQIESYKIKEVKEGDAQGWVTFDAYRFFSVMSNEWSRTQEELYQKIVAKEKVDPSLLSKVFPPRKYQYYGPISTSKYHVNALHKFSLLPLIPTVIQGKNIDNLHKRMMNSNIHYATFKTGSKIGVITDENGKADSFYKNSELRIMEDDRKPLMNNKIHLRFLRNQVPINDYYKNNVVFSTQLRALISNDLFNSGIPISKELGEKVQRYKDSVDAYIEAAKDELKKEINFKSNGTYDSFELAKIIKRELDRRDIPEHLQKVATTMNGKSFAFDLSLAKNAAEIESIIFSIANKRIVRRKFNGEPLIQAATTGFENERLTNATAEDIEKYKNDDLQIYRIDTVTGEHLPMEIKIAMQGDFKKLLYNEDVKKLAKERGIEPIQALNILIKDEKWLNKPVYPENSIYSKAFAKMESKKGDTKMFVLKSDLTPELLEQLTPDTKDGARVRGKEYFGIKILGDFYSHNTIKSRDGDNIDIIVVDNKADAEKQFQAYLKGGAKSFTRVVPIKKDTNKMLLRTVGVRIPVQGHNSMEYMQVAEFLPEEAGPIVIVPSYLVAKAGSDFDIDKLSIFFPNISGKTVYNLTEENIKEIAENPSLKSAFEKEINEGKFKTAEEIVKMYADSLKNKKKLSGLSENQKLILNEVKKFKDITDIRYAYGNNMDGLENQIMKNMIDLFNTDEVFSMMTKPNGTYLVKGLADNMVQYFELDYNPAKSLSNWNRSDIPDMIVSPTNIFELQYNYYKQFYNSVGKTSLGIAAVANKSKSLYNQVGFSMAKSYTHYRRNSKGQIKEQEREIRLLLEHAKEKDGSISLSKLYNVDGIKISDLINQMMNGYLDVAKDPWVAYVMGTPEATPTLLYLIMTGVSFENAVYFLAQPIIRRYLDDLKKFNSPAKLLDSTFTYENEFQIKRTYMGLDQFASSHSLFSEIMNSTGNALNRNPNIFKTNYLLGKLENSKKNYQDEIDLRNPENKAILAHFFEILDATTALKKVQQSFNFDTKTSSSLYDTFRRSKKRDILIETDDDETANYARMFPKEKLQKLYDDTILSTFDITDIQTSIFSKLFAIRDNENLNNYLYNIYKNEIFWGSNFSDRVNEKLGNNDKFVAEFKNDFTTAMVLKMLNDFNISDNKYKGFDIVEVKRDAFRRKDIQTEEVIETPTTIVSEDYGVVIAETNPSEDKTQQFINLIQPQIEEQAYKENIGKDANDMFMYGLRWTRKKTSISPLVNKSFANKGLPITEAKASDPYVYDTVDQNGNSLAPVSDLQPIINEIQNTLGIDMSNYDAVIGNIYLPGQNIATHRDTTESLSARNYPVIVYTIGNDSGIGIYENEKNPGAVSFASNKKTIIPTKNGSIYTFGMEGKGRFELAHDTPKGIKRDKKFPPITMPDGTVITNYTITLTFRRAADLEPGIPATPAKLTTTQSIISELKEPTVSTEIKVNPLVTVGVKPTDMSGNAAKDIQMAEESTQFIGYQSGTAKISSTNKYKEAWGDKANTGKYDSNDTIMVSGSGLWRGVTETQIRETLREKYKPLLEKAVEAGSSFRIGNQYAKGNLADKLVADYLQKRGYREERLDGYSRWSPEVKIKIPEAKPFKKGSENPRYVFTGVFIENEKIYLDYPSLKKIFDSLNDSDQTFIEVGNVLLYMPTRKAFRTFNEFVNYSIEKEYLRNNMSNEDIIPITNIYKNLYAGTAKKPDVLRTKQIMKISKDIDLKNFIATDGQFVQKPNGLQMLVDARTSEIVYDNVRIKGDILEFYTVDEVKTAESAKLKAIEMFLTDKALKNIYNEYSFTKDRLFNYPKQLMSVINTYPSLLSDYILPGLFEPIRKKNSSVTNLKLKSAENDSIFKAQLHEELNKLSDEGVIKHENPEVNKYISNIFSMLSTYSLFIEGYSKSAGLSISDIIDQTKLSEKMTIQNIDKTVKNDLSDSNYNRFLDLFSKQFFANRLGLSESTRGTWLRIPSKETKNYLINFQKSLEPAPISQYFGIRKLSDNFYTVLLADIIESSKQSRERNYVSNKLNEIADEFSDSTMILDVSQIKNIRGINRPNIIVVSSPEELMNSNIDGAIMIPSTGLPEKYDEVLPLVFGVANLSKSGRLSSKNEKIANIINSNAIFTSADIIQKIRAQAELIMEQINNSCNI